jgi:hypothetical protein
MSTPYNTIKMNQQNTNNFLRKKENNNEKGYEDSEV